MMMGRSSSSLSSGDSEEQDAATRLVLYVDIYVYSSSPIRLGMYLKAVQSFVDCGWKGRGDEANGKLRFDLIRVRLNEQKEHQELSSGWLHIVHYYSGAQHSVGGGSGIQ